MQSKFGAVFDKIVDYISILSTLVILLLKYYNNNLVEYSIFYLLYLLVCFGIGIKRKTNKDINNSYYWKIILTYLPSNVKSNFFTDSVDPGCMYLIILCGLYYGLFKLN